MSDRSKLLRVAQAQAELLRRRERHRLENSFIDFFVAAWPTIDAAPLQISWHHEAIAEHLEAIAYGRLRKLLINVPPRHTKTLLVSVAFPAWLWCREPDPDFPMLGPQAKFLCLSYSDQLAMDNATTARRLVNSKWYQNLWGNRLKIASDQDAKNKFDTVAGGSRISASFGGTVTGRGGDLRIIDDPHKVDEAESETTRENVLRVYDGTLKSRLSDPRTTSEIIIMQRLHEDDLAGHVLQTDDDFVHLSLPAEYDSSRHCVTSIGWEDPRNDDGELLWPDRFGPAELAPYKRNPYEWSGQWQQFPVPRGGAILRSEWWKTWSDDVHWPVFDFILASLDTAYTEKQENDYSAMTVWGVYLDDPSYLYIGADGKERGGTNRRRVMLIDAWQERLEFNDLVLKTAKTAKKNKVDKILVEAKANGISVAQELRRLHARELWGVETFDPKNLDKVARAHSVVSIFADGVIVAPDEDFAQMVIDQCATFPKGKFKDLVDSTTQAIKHLRDIGLAELGEELQAEFIDRQKFRPARSRRPIYVA